MVSYTESKQRFLDDLVVEHAVAVEKFPSPNPNMVALMEEVGELAQALLQKPAMSVRGEALQVAVMAMRVYLEGDPTVDRYRAKNGVAAFE